MNTNIRRAAISITAAGALALVGGGTAMADDAYAEDNRSFESMSVGPNGTEITTYESEAWAYFNDDDADDDDADDDAADDADADADENDDEDEDEDGLLDAGSLELD